MRTNTQVYADVMLLTARFGVPKVNTVIHHKDIELALGLHRRQSRMIYALRVWRAKLYEDHKVLLVNVMGTGYRAATTNGCIKWAEARLATAERYYNRAAKVVKETKKTGLSAEIKMAKDEFTFKAKVATEMSLFSLYTKTGKKTSTYQPASANTAPHAAGLAPIVNNTVILKNQKANAAPVAPPAPGTAAVGQQTAQAQSSTTVVNKPIKSGAGTTLKKTA